MMRRLMKTLTYGLMHVVVATLLAFALSGSWAIALSIGLLEPVVQTVFFYFHEKMWERGGQQGATPSIIRIEQ